jgi:hypothetical protein
MKLPKNPFLRKLFVLPLLAIGAYLVADVYQQITMRTPEEVLNALGAQQVLTQTMTVNDRPVVADVWRLPDFASATPLQKIKAKVITVGKIVYVFHDDFTSIRGQCTYPSDLPHWNINCNYVIDASHSRFISGSSPLAPATILADFAASAKADGWQPLNSTLWQKGEHTLFVHATEGTPDTHIMIAIQKELQ